MHFLSLPGSFIFVIGTKRPWLSRPIGRYNSRASERKLGRFWIQRWTPFSYPSCPFRWLSYTRGIESRNRRGTVTCRARGDFLRLRTNLVSVLIRREAFLKRYIASHTKYTAPRILSLIVSFMNNVHFLADYFSSTFSLLRCVRLFLLTVTVRDQTFETLFKQFLPQFY